MHQNIVLREEPFGYTFFDKNTMKHRCISAEEAKEFKGAKIMPMKHKNARKDILYSPIRIYFELTLKCNLRCKYCYNSSGIARSNELTTQEVFKALDHLKECNVMDVRFTGGEFTLRPDWYQVFKYAKKLGFTVSCNTNAAIYAPDTPQKLASLGLNQVTVSLDGDYETHEHNRGKHTFKTTLENIKKMHDLGVRLRLNTLVTRYSAKDVKFLLETAAKYAEEINFFSVSFIGRGAELAETEAVNVEDNLKMSRLIKRLKPNYPKLNVLHFEEVSKTCCVTTPESERFGLKGGYPQGTTTFNILSDGRYACGGYTPYIDANMDSGNIRTDSLFDIWQKNPTVEKIRDDSILVLNTCRNCPHSNKCQGAKYEVELYRKLNPNAVDNTCKYGRGESLLYGKHLGYRHGVSCIISSGDKFLLVRMREWPKGMWRFPQGGVEPNETERQAVLRELREETGLTGKIVRKYERIHTSNWHLDTIRRNGNRWQGQHLSLYRVVVPKGAKVKLQAKELEAYLWCSRADIARLTHSSHQDFLDYSKDITNFLSSEE